MPQVIEQGDVFGRIGKSLGKGAGEQLNRNRLSSGVEEIAGNKDLSEIQRYGQLLKLPGGAEHAGTLIPAIQRSQKNEAFKKAGQETVASEKTPSPQPQQEIKSSPKNQSLLASPQEITQYKQNLLQPVTQTDIDNLARRKLATGEALDSSEARQLASNELNQNFKSQDESIAKYRTDLNGRVGLGLQRAGLGGDSYKDVAGRIQQRLVDEGEYLKNVKGLSAEASSEKIDKIIDDLAKTTNSVNAAGELPFGDTKLKIEDFKKGKKEYDKYGFGEEYNDIVTTAGKITHLETAAMLNPLENGPLKKSLEKAVKPKFKAGIPSVGLRTVRRIGDEQLDDIISHIKPGDNILSIEHFLRDHRVDISDFKRRLNENHYDQLTERQKRELGKSVKNSFLGDILFRAFK